MAEGYGAHLRRLADKLHRAVKLRRHGDYLQLSSAQLAHTVKQIKIRHADVFRLLRATLFIRHERPLKMHARALCLRALPLITAYIAHRLRQRVLAYGHSREAE